MSHESKRRRSTLIFAETQRFDQPWLRLLVRAQVLLFLALPIALLVLVEPDPPHLSVFEHRLALAASLAALLLVLLVAGILRAARLESVVRREGIVVRFVPFHASDREFPVETISAAGIVSYAPLREYGGWGIRYAGRKRGWAYNVRGDKGLRLVLADGRRLLIGTQRPEELAAAIDELGLPPPGEDSSS